MTGDSVASHVCVEEEWDHLSVSVFLGIKIWFADKVKQGQQRCRRSAPKIYDGWTDGFTVDNLLKYRAPSGSNKFILRGYLGIILGHTARIQSMLES